MITGEPKDYGAQDDLTEYVRRKRPALRRVAFRLTADWYEADDLVQRTLIALLARWDTLDDRDQIGPYAYTVMNRLFISDRRSHRWSNEVLHEWPPEPGSVPDAYAFFSDRLLLLNALADLAPRQRAAVLLRYWHDRSVEETAEALGCMSSTVRSQTTRALATLRSLLEPDLGDGN
jgi:RNA polymerase sigma-70 factor (sigma-E family)